MTTDPNSGQGWYVPPAQGALQPAPAPAPAPPAAPSTFPAPLQPTGYLQPGAGAAPVPFDNGQGYGSSPWQQPSASRLATPGARLGALLLDGLLLFVTLFIGWIVWSLVVWGNGTTPGKALLKQRVVDAKTGRTATWGHMAVRQFLVGGLLTGVLNTLTFSVYFLVDAFMVFSQGHRRLTDRISSTLVVQD